MASVKMALPPGPEPSDPSAVMFANLALIGLVAFPLFEPWNEFEFNMWQIGRLAIVLMMGVTWLAVAGGIDARTPQQVAQSKQNLQKALSEPGAKGTGVSQDWYDDSTSMISSIKSVLGGVVGVLVVAAVTLSFPKAASTAIADEVQTGWLWLLDNFSERELFIWGVTFVFLGTFWTMSLLFAALDFLHGPTLTPFKVQEAKPVTPTDWVKHIPLVLVNHVVLFVCLLGVWEIYSRTAVEPFSNELPSLSTVVVHILIFLPAAEICFYFPHRLLHENQWLFMHIHRVHHSVTAPFAMSAIYAHPLEFIVGNVPVVAAGPLLAGCHMTTMWLWAAIALVQTCYAHSGWQMPMLPGNQSHDYHHSTFDPEGPQNLGTIGVLDHLLGTNWGFLRSWQAKVNKSYGTPDYPVDRILNSPPPSGEEDVR